MLDLARGSSEEQPCNPMTGSGMQQARELLAEKAAEVVKNHGSGTRARLAAVPRLEVDGLRSMWTQVMKSVEGRCDAGVRSHGREAKPKREGPWEDLGGAEALEPRPRPGRELTER